MTQIRKAATLRLEGVAKNYGQVVAVKPLDLVIEAGTLVTLLGPSGCGKTTLLRMIAGLERASQGRIFIGERDVTDFSAGERNVSMVFQSYALFPHMRVVDNVAFGLVSDGIGKLEAGKRAEATLETVGLSGLGQRFPNELSGGQQQRVAVARALVLEPDVLLFDEPLSNLDARLRRSMREEIRELQQRLGMTVVYVTHDQSEAMAVSDSIVVMKSAEIAQVGPPRMLYENPATRFVATFMGEANHVRGLAAIRAGEGRLVVDLAGFQLVKPDRGLGEGALDLVIRPEAISFAPEGSNGLKGRVATATFMGGHAEYTIETGIGRLFMLDRAVGPLRGVGSAVVLGLAEQGVFLVAP